MASTTFQKKVLKTAGWNPETTIPITQVDTVAEALASGHYGTEQDIMHAANATRRVRMDREVRGFLTDKPDATVADVSGAIDGYTYKQREPASGERKATVGKTKAKTAAALNETGVKFSKAQIAALVAAGALPAGFGEE